MAKRAPVNTGAAGSTGSSGRSVGYGGCRLKLHRWAAADPGRRFDDLFVRHEAPV